LSRLAATKRSGCRAGCRADRFRRLGAARDRPLAPLGARVSSARKGAGRSSSCACAGFEKEKR
jgi:hypothetical protein